MAIAQRLRSPGLSVISPAASAKAGQGIAWILRTGNAELVIAAKDLAADWKESLVQNGKFSDKKVDFLLEGEGTSAFAAQLQGLTSCRARVELRLIPWPVSTRGNGPSGAVVRAERQSSAGPDSWWPDAPSSLFARPALPPTVPASRLAASSRIVVVGSDRLLRKALPENARRV
jgi:hypothetical protein